MSISSHSDLAQSLTQFAQRLAKVPPDYMVSDASALGLVASASAALVEQDRRIGELTVALRKCRDLLPAEQRDLVNTALRK